MTRDIKRSDCQNNIEPVKFDVDYDNYLTSKQRLQISQKCGRYHLRRKVR